MRLDKYLKDSRIIKRRSVAKEACQQGRVRLNGKVAKAGEKVNIGDIIEISFGTGEFKARVLQLIKNARKKDADKLYELVD